ncbi:la-related protein 6A [Prosopis cineraria]|uniref:la-related protein 6A n=1 Tax=Prosopis cineraria TaxID=364024 RepID=UPI00240FB041|nr:la-related protein 6A [Prosopis cineraria]
MEGEERVSSAAAPDSHPSQLLHDDGGSDPADEVAELEIHSPLSDEEQDQEQEHDQEHDQDHAAETVTSVDDLKLKIIKQVEYYFSDENLPADKYLIGFLRKNKEGFVPISVIASFRKMKKLSQDHSLIVAALKESSLLVVSGDGKSVKRLNPFQLHEARDPKFFTVLVENLPEDRSKENIQHIFSEAGNIKQISIHDPCAIEGSQKSRKQKMISRKLHALVEYETIEAAEKAAATLNNEQDWRNGMRVKVLKKMTKHGHRKQAWKGSDSEKNSTRTSRVSELTGDEEHHSSNEHNEDTHDEEDGGEHLSKDRGGQRNRNRGCSRKHKYRGMHGMGHGSTSSSHHATEAPKPPPGPKMPDGTRGFTMGRGRVLGSSPS